MKFNSKTSLIEHIKELEKDGYLTSEWILKSKEKKTKAVKYYKINFGDIS